MNSSVATQLSEESAPVTLRSPPSTLRVRDRAVCVELALLLELAFADEQEPPTCRYARVA
jgi:hypothetical protein